MSPPLPIAMSDCEIWYPALVWSANGWRNVSRRARRYGSAMARRRDDGDSHRAPPPPRWRGRLPAATSTVATMSASTSAEPRSGSRITRKPNTASTRRTGFTTRRQSPISRAPAREIGGVEQQRELRQLGRLEPEHARAEPAPRPGDVHADARDEHDDQQHRAEDQQRTDESAGAGGSRSGSRPRTPPRRPRSTAVGAGRSTRVTRSR